MRTIYDWFEFVNILTIMRLVCAVNQTNCNNKKMLNKVLIYSRIYVKIINVKNAHKDKLKKSA